MADVRTPREVRAEEPLRRLSKRLLGSQYRIEVGSAIAAQGDVWTIDDLCKELPGLPRSSLAKEVKELLDLGLVQRGDEPLVRGSIPYRQSNDMPAFWTMLEQARRRLADKVIHLLTN